MLKISELQKIIIINPIISPIDVPHIYIIYSGGYWLETLLLRKEFKISKLFPISSMQVCNELHKSIFCNACNQIISNRFWNEEFK